MWRDGGAAIGREDTVAQEMFDSRKEGGREGVRGKGGGGRWKVGRKVSFFWCLEFVHLPHIPPFLSLPPLFPPSLQPQAAAAAHLRLIPSE